MRTARIRNNEKEEKPQIIEEEYSIKKMLIIILVIVVVFVVFYFITTLVAKPKLNDDKDNTPVVIDSSKILVSGLLNRSSDEYYVLATKKAFDSSLYTEINYKVIYDNYISNYKRNDENAIKFYYIDLDDALNKNYLGEETKISNNLEELKISDDVLFKIKNKKIEKSYVGNKEIIKALSELVPKEKEK